MDPLTRGRPASDLAAVALVVVAAAAVAVTFAPWHHSGSAVRNSHELLAAADRLGVLEGTWQRVLATAWPVLPLVLALAAVGLALGARPVAAVLALVGGALELAVSIVVMRTGGAAGWGATVGAVTGTLLVASSVALVLPQTRRGERSEP